MSNSTGFPLRQAREPVAVSLFKRALARLGEPLLRFKAVNELEQLSDRQLRDIGVERRQIEEIAEREIARKLHGRMDGRV
ncbi:DUF1127 domain-containing protein [Taklimakanibacter deserti]|uniref:DUF1127 domain-containing protein n=1 Tax=Taklimakanibacter deserti TaxID=2267839 RepID=UPI000E658DE6